MKIIKIGFHKIFFIIFVFLLIGCGGDSSNSETSDKYPLHKDIIVTYFYVGEKASANNDYIPNEESSWDNIWLWDFGGVDNPAGRDFTPSENSFYFALPYNDLGEDGKPKETQKQIPWYRPTNTTILKNRWIKIIKGDKVAYAQWEDCGPYEYDDFEYVFGDASPKNSFNGAGLDVSPDVKNYLGLKDKDKISWQFVDDEEVPEGPWKRVVTTQPARWIPFKEIDSNMALYRQLNGELNLSNEAEIFDINLSYYSKEDVEKLHNSDKVVICEFVSEDKNLTKLIEKLDFAKEQGCDGVVTNSFNDFEFGRLFSIDSKKRGLLVGLERADNKVQKLVDYFDFGFKDINCEDNSDNCDEWNYFKDEDKPLFEVPL